MSERNSRREDITGGPADKQGFVHWAGKIMGKDIKTGADMQQFVNKFGAQNVSHMFDGNGSGDFRGDSNIVGSWARHVISVDSNVPADYTELAFNLTHD